MSLEKPEFKCILLFISTGITIVFREYTTIPLSVQIQSVYEFCIAILSSIFTLADLVYHWPICICTQYASGVKMTPVVIMRAKCYGEKEQEYDFSNSSFPWFLCFSTSFHGFENHFTPFSCTILEDSEQL